MEEQLNELNEEAKMLLNYANSLKCTLNSRFDVHDANEELDNIRANLTERILRIQKIGEIYKKMKQFYVIGKMMNCMSHSFDVIANNTAAVRSELAKNDEKQSQKVHLNRTKNEGTTAGTTAATATATAATETPLIAHFTKSESSSVPNYLGRYTEKNLNDFVDMLNGFWLRKQTKMAAKKGMRSKEHLGRAFLSELEICEFMNKPQLDKKTINLLAVLKKFNKIVESKDKDLKKFHFN